MLSGTIAFMLGIGMLYQLAELPPISIFVLLWLMPWPFFYLTPRGVGLAVLAFAAGFTLAAVDAKQQLEPALTPELEGMILQVKGVVDSLPQYEGRMLRFEFALEEGSTLGGKPVSLPDRVRLSWYNDYPYDLAPGQRWQLRVKLKRPWSMRNPGGFDYEQWLFQQGIRATGYVRARGENSRLEEVSGYRLMRFRHRLQQVIADSLTDHPMAGVIRALAIGERAAISDSQWNTLLATGTNHLVAISGLHVGLVAGLVLLLTRRLWRLCPACCQRLAAPRVASLVALLAAVGYAALAGFAIPTQRALVMLAVVLGAVWLQRPVPRTRVLVLALWMVLLFAPASILSAGFWLSFSAVAWILYGMSGRVEATGLWWRWGRVQLLVAAGLLPLLLFFFQQGSLSSPLANLIAVPLVSLLVVPLTLLGVVFAWWPSAATGLLWMAAELLRGLWPLLQWLSNSIPLLPVAAADWTLVPALCGLMWLFAPHGWPMRYAGLILLLPLLLWRPTAPEVGTARFTLLDVGQGLSAVVQTANHVLVFDTGPRYPSGFDTGEAVVVPYLREQGISQIDTLVISHSGNDHAGGTRSVASQLQIERIISSVSDVSEGLTAEPCWRGQSWRWDGVTFRLLHPASKRVSGEHNNHSCVLKVTSGGESVLITADIEAAAERELLASGVDLSAEILVAPHHGSKTSSTQAFVEAVAPKQVLFAVGYRNRYGFPHSAVVKRYRDVGAGLVENYQTGALTFVLGDGQQWQEAFRPSHRRIWHAQECDSCH